jgi:hypothetical protein
VQEFEQLRRQHHISILVPLAYWVEYVRHLGGQQIAALIVQTRCDRPEDRAVCPVPEKSLREAFNAYYPLSYSSTTDRGRAFLDGALADAISWLHDQQGIVHIGAGRHRVKVRLESMRYADAKYRSRSGNIGPSHKNNSSRFAARKMDQKCPNIYSRISTTQGSFSIGKGCSTTTLSSTRDGL